MAGLFEDLIPQAQQPAQPQAQGGMFDDLIPQAPAATVPGAPGSTVQPTAIAPQPIAPAVAPAPVGATPSIPTGDVTPSGRLVVGGVNAPPQQVDRPMSLLPSSVGGAARDFQVGAQGVGHGLQDIALAPFDLAAGAQNLVTGGINKVFGTNIPEATPASRIAQTIEDKVLPGIDPATMSNSEKLMYNANRFGTQAVAGGTALATRAPALAAQTAPSTTFGGRVADTLARPYVEAPVGTVARDATAGLGAGAGQTASDQFVPEHPAAGDWLKKTSDVVAPLVGAIGGGLGHEIVSGLGNVIAKLGKRVTTQAPQEIPLNPNTHAPYKSGEIDEAARTMQASSQGAPSTVADTIRENARNLGTEAHETPTSGLLSQDPGIVTLEQNQRTRRSPDFVERDQNVKGGAAERIAGLRDEGADLNAPKSLAETLRERALAAPQQNVDQAQREVNAIERVKQDQGAPFATRRGEDSKVDASRSLDRALVDRNYVPERDNKNRLFDQAPGRHDELPIDEISGTIDEIRRRANGLAPGTLPHDFMQRLDALRPQMVEGEGPVMPGGHPPPSVNEGGPGTATGGDLADLRKFIGAAQQRAQQSGNFDLATNLGTLKGQVNRTIEEAPGYSEANANYRNFADRFRPERNDEGAKFTREIDRGGQDAATGELNRGATPPSATAERFLKSPEKAQALQRMMAGAPSEEAGNRAIRDYMRSDFAQSALNDNGTINPARAAAWSRNNADVLAQFPTIRQEFDDLTALSRRGEALTGERQQQLKTAQTAFGHAESDFDRSAAGTLLREDPRDVAKRILGPKFANEAELNRINQAVGQDEAARRGWKAAVAEVLTDRVTSAKQVGENYEAQYARLAKEFKDNEDKLAKVFTPEEMNSLRQAHKMLGYFKEAEKRATVGSQTAERNAIPGWVQLVVRHFKGDLAGGGLLKRFRLLLDQLPSNKQGADDILHMAFFDPSVAAYLLERPLPSTYSAHANINLRRLELAANSARKTGPDDNDD